MKGKKFNKAICMSGVRKERTQICTVSEADNKNNKIFESRECFIAVMELIGWIME
jgi:hypothetical protein